MNQLHVTGKQKIGNFEFIGIEGGFGEGKKALLVKDIAKIHQTEVKRVNELINRNIRRFIEGVDLIDLKQAVSNDLFSDYGFTKAQWGNANNIYILSERGYFKLLKILEDDTAWDIYDQLIDNYFNYRKTVQSIGSDMSDLDVRRMNATARLENARVRKAKLLAELANDSRSDVNRAILHDKATEVLTGEKLLEMPKLNSKFYSAHEIAKKLGIHSKTGNPHETAVSQLIQKYILLEDDETEFFLGSTDNWSGDVTKYAESVIDKVESWLMSKDYPSVIKSNGKNYHVKYEF